jgi:hypothetical protein
MSEYPGIAYEYAKVRPGDRVHLYSGETKSPFHPDGAEVITPEEARHKYMDVDPNEYIYTVRLPDKKVVSGYRPSGLIKGFPGLVFVLMNKPTPNPQLVGFKQQNDSGGINGKCVSCNSQLREWMRGRFHCPKCEP